MIGFAIDIASLVIIGCIVLWGVWMAIKYFWPSAETSAVGQVVGKVTDTTQAYAMYGFLESMKLDNQVKADLNALGAIAYLQSVVLRGVAKDWTVATPTTAPSTTPVVVDNTPENAEIIQWGPEQ